MAIHATLLNRTMTLSVKDGDEAVKNRTFSPLNPDASNEQLYNAANALGSLMDGVVEKIVYSERNQLNDEEEE